MSDFTTISNDGRRKIGGTAGFLKIARQNGGLDNYLLQIQLKAYRAGVDVVMGLISSSQNIGIYDQKPISHEKGNYDYTIQWFIGILVNLTF